MNLVKSNTIRGTLVAILSLFLISSVETFAQSGGKQPPKDVKSLTEEIQKKFNSLYPEEAELQKQNSFRAVKSGVDLGSLEDDFMRFTQDKSWILAENPNSNFNVSPSKTPIAAGDINGDGLGDYFMRDFPRNIDTPELEDIQPKSIVYFGGNTSITPDQIIDQWLVPIGDINGDGFDDAVHHYAGLIWLGSSNGYTDSGVELVGDGLVVVEGGVNDYGLAQNMFYSGGDLDGDGLDDVIHHRGGWGGNEFVIYWGDDSGNFGQNFSTYSFIPNGNRYFEGYISNAEDFDGDGDSEIYLFGFDTQNVQDVIRIFDIQADRMSTTILQDLQITNGVPLPINAYALDVFDINNDGFKEIYLFPTYPQTGDDNYVFTEDSGNPGFYGPDDIVFFSGTSFPAGDMNDDGKMDFFLGDPEQDNAPYLGYGPDSLDAGLNLDLFLPLGQGDFWRWMGDASYGVYDEFGDMTGDGVDDYPRGLLEASNRETGRVIIEGNTSGDPTFQRVLAPQTNFNDQAFDVVNVGDVNGDGFDDFAVSRINTFFINVYFGGETISDNPDLVLDSFIVSEHKDGFTFFSNVLGITGGDFNGDGYSDIVTSNNYGSEVNVYYGSASMDGIVDHEIVGRDFRPGSTASVFYNVHNIGDVNDDGFEDILLGSLLGGETVDENREYYNEAYLFLGSTSGLPSTPDVTILLNDPGPNIFAGYDAASLGDINEDGINDFAVSSPFDEDGNGKVNVYFGRANSDFVDPELELRPATTDIDGFGYSITAGDFDGDGSNDIAVSSQFFATYVDGVENPAIHIFKGGTELDEGPDHFLQFEASSVGLGFEGTDNFFSGSIHTIPDFDNNGTDEIAALGQYTNAALFSGDSGLNEYQTSVLIAPNSDDVLGGRYTNAIGDFDGDGLQDIIASQFFDNNDAWRSSRVYRYELPRPINISSIEDVPDDQGGWVRVNTSGFYMDALNAGIWGFDHWSVWLKDGEKWTNLATVPAYIESTNYVDVHVPTTKPTDGVGDGSTYQFKVVAYNGNQDIVSESDIIEGFALDNLAPPAVGGVFAERGAGEVELSWDPSSSSDLQGYSVFKVDSDGETLVGTSDETSITVSDSEFEGLELFVVKAKDVNNNVSEASKPAPAIFPVDLAYNVSADWNLIGLPLNASDVELQNLKSKIVPGTLYEFNNSYEQATELIPGKGYWAKFPNTAEHIVTGLPIVELELNLKKGWNMISGVGAILAQSGIQDFNNILIPGTLRSFDGGYVEAENLRPGSGYWIRAEKAGTLKFSLLEESEAKGSVNSYNERLAALNKAREEMNRIVISNGEGHSQKLYFGSELPDGVDKLSFSRPPAAPGEVFGAGYANNKLTFTEQNELSVHIQNPKQNTLSLKLQLNDHSQYQTYEVRELKNGIVLAEYLIDSDEPVQIQNGDTEALKISPVGVNGLSADKPQSFELYSNYPNPFNPTTVIRYAVPKVSDVALEVYNIAGARVATLVNEPKAAGNHKVTFDASNLSSGIYFVRIQAGAFHEVQKITLIK